MTFFEFHHKFSSFRQSHIVFAVTFANIHRSTSKIRDFELEKSFSTFFFTTFESNTSRQEFRFMSLRKAQVTKLKASADCPTTTDLSD